MDINIIMMPRINPIIKPLIKLLGVLLLVIDASSLPCKLMVGFLMSISMLHAICPIEANIIATVPRMICQGTALGEEKKDMTIVVSNASIVNIALNTNFAKICE